MRGVRFACQRGCTNCCRQHGYVYLTQEDLERAAAFLGLSPAAFEAKYIYRTRNFLRLRKPRDGSCHFLEEESCSLHPAKPTQCRLYPFWPELVGDRLRWARAARVCPGIGTGPLVQIGTALETAAEMKRAYPAMYGF